MKIVIPSYRRQNILKEKTLKLLENHNIPKSCIDIIVESKDAKKEYRKVIGKEYKIIISDTKGICEKRNFIRYYYRHETKENKILCIDDDIIDIQSLYNGVDIKELFVRGFEFAKKCGACIWGINHLHNHHFMKKQKPIVTRLNYIQGGFCGIYIDRTKEPIYADIDHYEDFQFSCEHYLRDGAILKLNHYYIITDYTEETGGIAESLGGKKNRIINAKENLKYMMLNYAPMVKIKNSPIYGEDLLINAYYRLPVNV